MHLKPQEATPTAAHESLQVASDLLREASPRFERWTAQQFAELSASHPKEKAMPILRRIAALFDWRARRVREHVLMVATQTAATVYEQYRSADLASAGAKAIVAAHLAAQQALDAPTAGRTLTDEQIAAISASRLGS